MLLLPNPLIYVLVGIPFYVIFLLYHLCCLSCTGKVVSTFDGRFKVGSLERLASALCVVSLGNQWPASVLGSIFARP